MGCSLGCLKGRGVGDESTYVGNIVGLAVGAEVGEMPTWYVGAWYEGARVGAADGAALGGSVGSDVGSSV